MKCEYRKISCHNYYYFISLYILYMPIQITMDNIVLFYPCRFILCLSIYILLGLFSEVIGVVSFLETLLMLHLHFFFVLLFPGGLESRPPMSSFRPKGSSVFFPPVSSPFLCFSGLFVFFIGVTNANKNLNSSRFELNPCHLKRAFLTSCVMCGYFLLPR